jgi:hypothetical protein
VYLFKVEWNFFNKLNSKYEFHVKEHPSTNALQNIFMEHFGTHGNYAIGNELGNFIASFTQSMKFCVVYGNLSKGKILLWKIWMDFLICLDISD